MTGTDDQYFELIENGDFIDASSLRVGFFSEPADLQTVFGRIWTLRDRENWEEIDSFMGREYLCDWLDYKASKGDLTDRTLVFRRSPIVGPDADGIALDRLVREKVSALFERNEICDLYDILSLCTERYPEFGPDIKGLLQTFFDYCDDRRVDYILATQYEPDIDEGNLRELYRQSRAILGLEKTASASA